MNLIKRILHTPFFIRLLHWEYWSFGAIYTLIFPVWFFLCLRARSLFFFAASNPSIENGGFLNESKKDIHPFIPPEFAPASLFFSFPADPVQVLMQLKNGALIFPLIGKPDKGGRGRGVKRLLNEADLIGYVQNAKTDFHIQQFVPYKNEVGIFYYRFPGSEKGDLSGIVRKEFLTIRGNGKSTIEELVRGDQRALLQLESLRNIYGSDRLSEVLQDGVSLELVPYGNHARGALFIDDSELIDESLRVTIDSICRRMPDFYFGRLDIRYDNWEDLKQGKNLSVIEVNGAGSEPTHIYDPRHSLFFAWKEIVRHWILLYRISRLNHRLGHPYLRFSEGIRMFREDKELSKKLAQMPE